MSVSHPEDDGNKAGSADDGAAGPVHTTTETPAGTALLTAVDDPFEIMQANISRSPSPASNSGDPPADQQAPKDDPVVREAMAGRGAII